MLTKMRACFRAARPAAPPAVESGSAGGPVGALLGAGGGCFSDGGGVALACGGGSPYHH